jgi:hypothetical protein
VPAHDDDDLPPEADLIRRARGARKMSPEDAAPLAGVIKARRWRQIEGGWPVSDEVLAHMAAAVGVSPAQLDEVKRGEAAQILREIARQTAVPDLSVLTEDEQKILATFIRLIETRLAERDQDGRRGA